MTCRYPQAAEHLPGQPRIATTGSSLAARSAGTAAATTPVTAASRTVPNRDRGRQDQREQLAAVGQAHVVVPDDGSGGAQGCADDGAGETEQAPLHEKKRAEFVPVTSPSRANSNILRPLDDGYRQHAGDTECDRQADEQTDHGVGDFLALTAVKNWALVLIQLSARTDVVVWIARAMFSAVKTSATVTSIS